MGVLEWYVRKEEVFCCFGESLFVACQRLFSLRSHWLWGVECRILPLSRLDAAPFSHSIILHIPVYCFWCSNRTLLHPFTRMSSSKHIHNNREGNIDYKVNEKAHHNI